MTGTGSEVLSFSLLTLLLLQEINGNKEIKEKKKIRKKGCLCMCHISFALQSYKTCGAFDCLLYCNFGNEFKN
jgi:hypothetical protein